MTTAKDCGDIAMDFTDHRISKLLSAGTKDPLVMASTGSLISADSTDSEISEEQKREKIAELKKKQKDLEKRLSQKIEELKKVCLREADLTGKLPKEYPVDRGEKAPPVRRRVGTAFKLDGFIHCEENPHLQELESQLALQQQIVEAAKNLANEEDLHKTVKKKRRNDYIAAMKKLEDIRREISIREATKGKKHSILSTDDACISELSSLSGSLTLDGDDDLGSQREQLRSAQYSPGPYHGEQHVYYNPERRASAHDQLGDNRSTQDHFLSPHYYQHDASSSVSADFRPTSRQPRDARSMPPTPVLTRNAYSSTHLRLESLPQTFHQYSGSLESLSQLMTESNKDFVPAYRAPAAHRSSSTEVLEALSSYSNKSNTEFIAPVNRPHRLAGGGRHRKDMYRNTGSMPNLVESDGRCYAYQPQARPTATAYYVTGCTKFVDFERYPGGAYMYESESDIHYNPAYYPSQAPYHSGMHNTYASSELDSGSQSRYTTLRPPRNVSSAHTSTQHLKNFHKAVVAEHLKGWYERNTNKQGPYSYDYDSRGSQQSTGFQNMGPVYPQNHRNTSYTPGSSVSSSRNWNASGNRGFVEYDTHYQEPQAYSYNAAPYSHSNHSRFYMDVNPVDPHRRSPMCPAAEQDERICWHEDSEPGTIV